MNINKTFNKVSNVLCRFKVFFILGRTPKESQFFLGELISNYSMYITIFLIDFENSVSGFFVGRLKTVCKRPEKRREI